MHLFLFFCIAAFFEFFKNCDAFSTAIFRKYTQRNSRYLATKQDDKEAESIFTSNTPCVNTLKSQILQLGAALDRGQSYNPTSGDYYKERMEVVRTKIESLISLSPPLPTSLQEISGDWELVISTVPHGIFRSSPFFLAIQEAFYLGGEGDKANLFFKLHELQVMSWGLSKVGRVAQSIDAQSKVLISEFDTSIFSLTVIPIVGWFKLLPTFGGCVVTVSSVELDTEGRLHFEVNYTTAQPVPGLQGLGKWIWDTKVPVGAVWQLLPWNKGRKATCYVDLKYVDTDFRIVQDRDGEFFVYTRPVCSRAVSNIK